MSIQGFLDQDVVVRRLRTISGYRKGFSSTATVDGHIQELDDEARQVLGIVEERAWRAWFDVDTDINEQDRITDSDGKVYVVREVTKKDYAFGVNVHLEVVLQEQNE
jgi:hypothetical protein